MTTMSYDQTQKTNPILARIVQVSPNAESDYFYPARPLMRDFSFGVIGRFPCFCIRPKCSSTSFSLTFSKIAPELPSRVFFMRSLKVEVELVLIESDRRTNLRSFEVRCERFGCLPERHFLDGKFCFLGLLINQLRDVFCRRVCVDDINRLVEFLQKGDRRIVAVQDHFVVEFVVDPGSQRVFDVAEVYEHPPFVEVFTLQNDDGATVMSVKLFAFAIVVQQAMTIAKFDFLCDAIHSIPFHRE